MNILNYKILHLLLYFTGNKSIVNIQFFKCQAAEHIFIMILNKTTIKDAIFLKSKQETITILCKYINTPLNKLVYHFC